ncbi:MAG: hypothetical protein LBO72_08685 [Helicobacteraceae bacterium]|nr:hypothetical protein [Helicobacteraceae bacterium]
METKTNENLYTPEIYSLERRLRDRAYFAALTAHPIAPQRADRLAAKVSRDRAFLGSYLKIAA